MDKNTITGFILIAAVLIGYGIWSQPSAEERIAMMRQDSINAVKKQEAELSQTKNAGNDTNSTTISLKDTTALFYSSLTGTEKHITLKNKSVELTLSTKGGTVEKAVVKNFTDYNGNPDVTLFDKKDQNLRFMLLAKENNIITSDLYFTPSEITDTTVTMTASSGHDKNITMKYTLGKDYMLHMEFQAKGMEGLFSPNYNMMDVDWNEMCRQQEKGFTFENQHTSLTYHKSEGGTKYLSETSEEKDKTIDDKINWIAFKNQFFSAVMISKNDFAENSLLTSIPQQKGSGYLKQYQAKMKTFFDPSGKKPSEFDFYFGPNDFRLLKRVENEAGYANDLELQRLVYLGWPLFRIINRWFTIYVFDFLTGMNINMGIILILITMLLKLITYPLVKKSYLSSAKMRVLKPKLEEATKQYNRPEDQMQKQQAMMAEYAKYGVSPLSGCLPMLIQLPIWVAMFNFVPNAIQLRGESFLWIEDLSTYDPIIEWNTNIWLIGDHLSLTCILFCVSNVIYSVMTMRQQKDQMVGQQAEQMKMMQWMLFLMPVMFFFMFNDYSSGLNFYYFVSLFFSAAIMWTLRKTTNDEKLLAKLEARYQENKNNPKKISGLAARLQAMQEQQMELQRKREELERKRKGL